MDGHPFCFRLTSTSIISLYSRLLSTFVKGNPSGLRVAHVGSVINASSRGQVLRTLYDGVSASEFVKTGETVTAGSAAAAHAQERNFVVTFFGMADIQTILKRDGASMPNPPSQSKGECWGTAHSASAKLTVEPSDDRKQLFETTCLWRTG